MTRPRRGVLLRRSAVSFSPLAVAALAACGGSPPGGAVPGEATPGVGPPPAFVFLSERTGQGDIYVGDVTGTRFRRLTFSDASDYGPRWVEGPGALYFLSDRLPDSGVYRMPLSGDDGEAEFVAPNPAGEETPHLSPDGMWIAYASRRDGNRDIYVSRPDGTGERRVTHDSADDAEPRWSPDGRSLAFVTSRDGNREVYTVEVWGGEPRNLTRSRSSNEGNPSWSPDGTRLLFDSDRPPGGNPDIFVTDIDGWTIQNLTRHRGADLVASWSPDGDWIAFGSSRDGDWEVYVMRADGSGQRRITFSRGYDGDANWVPAERVRW